MADTKELSEAGSSGSEEGDPDQECTESESVRTESRADIQTVLHLCSWGSVLMGDPFLLIGIRTSRRS